MSSPLRWRLSHPSVTFDVLVGNSVPAYLCVVMSSLLGSQWGDLHHVQICSLTCTHLVCICHPLSTPPPPPPPLSPWWQVCSLESIWQPWPGKVHIWHWTSLSLHSPHSSFTSPGHDTVSFVLSAQFLLSSQHDLLHSWNSWDCGDQMACEATLDEGTSTWGNLRLQIL